ncbi:MAG TPA: SDR family oxidoreductase [Thermoleophilaceae bacterium]|jgi:NAD(P)-dependent dehydrogenase (short-subunit alcohol dehydrogenase family)|nr:SDR family oxidoreductase [Thermoleophilaceae bacterium]
MASTEVVVVTGATSGIGRAIARRFAQDGASIGLIARGRDGLAGARKDVEEAGGRALELPCDVSEWDAVNSAARAVEEAFGPIDVWVNNAMTTVFAPFKEIDPDEFRRATDVTYHGAVWGTKAALDRMLPRDRGSIVLVGSALAYRGIPLQAPYCGAKHAEKGFFESLRTELRHDKSSIHLSMVQLPGLNTPQFVHCRSKMPMVPQPMPPYYQPEVAADAVHWAAHHRRRELFVGTPTVKTILGNKVAPWLVERVLAKQAYGGQQSDKPADPDRRDNLMSPPPGDPGAHGPYDQKARSSSVQTQLAKRRGLVGMVTALVLILTGVLGTAQRSG